MLLDCMDNGRKGRSNEADLLNLSAEFQCPFRIGICQSGDGLKGSFHIHVDSQAEGKEKRHVTDIDRIRGEIASGKCT